MASSDRSHRVEEQIKRIIAQIIVRETRDPALQMVSLTAVKVTPDLSRARIYITSLIETIKREEIIKALNEASGFFRHKLSKQMNLRRVPEIYFVYDESIEYAKQMEDLIQNAIEDDESNKKSV